MPPRPLPIAVPITRILLPSSNSSSSLLAATRAHNTISPLSRSISSKPVHHLPLKPHTNALSRTLTTSTYLQAGPRESAGDYGSGAGDPKGEAPQEQGTSATARAKEHPGPESPASSSSSSSGSSAGSSKQPTSKLHREDAQSQGHDISQESSRVESEDVKQHNEEMKKRHDRPSEVGGDVEEKVDKGYWSGSGTKDS